MKEGSQVKPLIFHGDGILQVCGNVNNTLVIIFDILNFFHIPPPPVLQGEARKYQLRLAQIILSAGIEAMYKICFVCGSCRLQG